MRKTNATKFKQQPNEKEKEKNLIKNKTYRD